MEDKLKLYSELQKHCENKETKRKKVIKMLI
jgi:hypothetical protein